MEQAHYYIVLYKDLHPIRFWMLLIGVIVLLSAVIGILIRSLKKAGKIKENNQKETEWEAKLPLVEHVNARKKQAHRTKVNRLKLWIGIGALPLAICIVLIALLLLYEKLSVGITENPTISSSTYVFGIDVSHYQGKIDWAQVSTSKHPIEFVFMRATMGEDGVDRYFKRNWRNAKRYNYVRGAYHYYRPNENSTKQFQNFKSVVTLEQGDFYPVLDIEKEGRYGRKNLREGVLNWLKLAEEAYGVKPIVYTGLKFYHFILKGHIDGYPLWIAAYSGKHRLHNVRWTFHQFTDKVRVKGIQAAVDGNDFNGAFQELDNVRISSADGQ